MTRPVHAWTPWSPCGPSCLPRSGNFPQVGVARAALRLLSGAGLLFLGGFVGLVMPVLGRRGKRAVLRWWFGQLLRAFGVQLVVRGEEHLADAGRGRGVLVASNHVSWLDIVALQAVCPMRLLAKSELRSWPVIGVLAGRAGTLYIDRDRLRSLPKAVEGVADALRGGSVVGAFPEGTTWCGLASGRYRPAVFQAAVDAGASVHAAGLRFQTANGHVTTAAAFVGESTLMESLITVARTRGLVAELIIFPELDARTIANRRELAQRAQAAVTSVTLPEAHVLPHPRRESEPVAAA